MFCWSSAGRLRPNRMVWLGRNYNDPKHELIKYQVPRIRSYRRNLQAETKVERSRELRYSLPGETGKWPLNRKPKRK